MLRDIPVSIEYSMKSTDGQFGYLFTVGKWEVDILRINRVSGEVVLKFTVIIDEERAKRLGLEEVK